MAFKNNLFSAKTDFSKPAKPLTSATGVVTGSKFLRVRKDSLNQPAKALRDAQNVGKFDPNKPATGAPQPAAPPPPMPRMTVTAAAREVVKPYTRKESGKVILVKGHTRRGEEKQVSTKEETLKHKQAKDLELWLAWKQGGMRGNDIKPLLARFKGMIQSRASVYKGKVRIPPAAIDAEFKKQFIRALKAYNPDKGSLGTFVFRYLDAAKRFISNYQNVARNPETRIYKIGQFNTARSHLDELLGRGPKEKELADYLKWPLKEVQRLSTELRKGLIRSEFAEFDPSSWEAA